MSRSLNEEKPLLNQNENLKIIISNMFSLKSPFSRISLWYYRSKPNYEQQLANEFAKMTKEEIDAFIDLFEKKDPKSCIPRHLHVLIAVLGMLYGVVAPTIVHSYSFTSDRPEILAPVDVSGVLMGLLGIKSLITASSYETILRVAYVAQYLKDSPASEDKDKGIYALYTELDMSYLDAIHVKKHLDELRSDALPFQYQSS